MKKLIQASTLFSVLFVAASCSTLPEDPRTWESIEYKKKPAQDISPQPSKFHNVFDEGSNSANPNPGPGGIVTNGTHGN